jgi:hypothetical protein
MTDQRQWMWNIVAAVVLVLLASGLAFVNFVL